MTREELPAETPREDMMREALKHYEELAAIACWHRSDIPKAIMAYYTSSTPAEGAEQEKILTDFAETMNTAMVNNDPEFAQIVNDHYFDLIEQPTAEGAEKILLKQRNGEDRPITYALGKDGWVYKMILRAMREFATLHAQRIADKMVEERLREELIKYDHYLVKQKWGIGIIQSPEQCADEYLKSRSHE